LCCRCRIPPSSLSIISTVEISTRIWLLDLLHILPVQHNGGTNPEKEQRANYPGRAVPRSSQELPRESTFTLGVYIGQCKYCKNVVLSRVLLKLTSLRLPKMSSSRSITSPPLPTLQTSPSQLLRPSHSMWGGLVCPASGSSHP
jgi:hypothetical protein